MAECCDEGWGTPGTGLFGRIIGTWEGDLRAVGEGRASAPVLTDPSPKVLPMSQRHRDSGCLLARLKPSVALPCCKALHGLRARWGPGKPAPAQQLRRCFEGPSTRSGVPLGPTLVLQRQIFRQVTCGEQSNHRGP